MGDCLISMEHVLQHLENLQIYHCARFALFFLNHHVATANDSCDGCVIFQLHWEEVSQPRHHKLHTKVDLKHAMP
jgi:hypothetical protein